jgi:alcohol dehydrogenase class IV
MDWLLSLRASVGIPHDLTQLGIPSTDIELVGEMSVRDGCADCNPVRLSALQYSGIFRAALRGAL